MEKFEIYKEIHNQPKTWELIIEKFEENKSKIINFLKSYDSFYFTGCGSGLNAAVYSKNIAEFFLEKSCFAYQSSEIMYYGTKIYKKGLGGKPLTFLFSRSGDTTETIKALKILKNNELSDSFGITCYEESYLYKNSNYAFSLKDANEKAVVTTKSFTSMVLLPLMIFNEISENLNFSEKIKTLPLLAGNIINKYEKMSKEIGERPDINKFFILSNTPNFGLAREIKLKFLEMTISWADCFNTFDFRHGPKAAVDKNSLIVHILSDNAEDEEFKLAKELKEFGANLLIYGNNVPEEFYDLTDYIININEEIPEYIRGILLLPIIHFISYYKSVKKGLNPDKPKNLTYFVKI
jgi:glucosamine--fructose-6-phosphate aminotransferase (isomerizing)